MLRTSRYEMSSLRQLQYATLWLRQYATQPVIEYAALRHVTTRALVISMIRHYISLNIWQRDVGIRELPVISMPIRDTGHTKRGLIASVIRVYYC